MVSLYSGTSCLFYCIRIDCQRWCQVYVGDVFSQVWVRVAYSVQIYIYIYIYTFNYASCYIRKSPGEIRNRGLQGGLIATTRDETFWGG